MKRQVKTFRNFVNEQEFYTQLPSSNKKPWPDKPEVPELAVLIYQAMLDGEITDSQCESALDVLNMEMPDSDYIKVVSKDASAVMKNPARR